MNGFKIVERVVEVVIWNSRRAMFFAVIACLLAYFAVLLMTVIDLINIVMPVFKRFIVLDIGHYRDALHQETLRNVVGLVDSFLVAIFLLVFSFGLYELFVSELDPARDEKKTPGDRAILGLLSIHNLDDLKRNLVKVITAILIVTLFENAVALELKSPVDLVYYAAAIVLVALALFIIQLTTNKSLADPKKDVSTHDQ